MLWIPANALAWALGMAVIFAGIDPAVGGGSRFLTVAVLALPPSCVRVVGATHGLALVCLLRRRASLTLA
jgi:hypothetical protein